MALFPSGGRQASKGLMKSKYRDPALGEVKLAACHCVPPSDVRSTMIVEPRPRCGEMSNANQPICEFRKKREDPIVIC